MRKVLLIEFWNCTPHIETALEISKNHADKGDEVKFIFLGHDTPYQEGLSLTAKRASFLTRLPERKGVDLIGSHRMEFIPRCELPRVAYDCPEFFVGIDELMGFRYKQFEAGLAVASSLVSRYRNSNPDMQRHASEVRIMLDSAIRVYEYSKKVVEEEKPDIVYVFNGRFCNPRAVMRAAQESGVEVRIHERGASKNKYISYSFMPHDFIKTQEEMASRWKSANWNERREMGEGFFEKNRQGVEQGWKSFIDGQEKNVIPDFDQSKKIVTYFSSSDDEYVAVGDVYRRHGWRNQMQAVSDLIEVCRELGGVQFFLKLHPHLREKSVEDQRRWLGLGGIEGVNLIPYDSNIDTYAMIEGSDIVVTSGSTVGIEAVYWGTPSITLGPSYYSELGATYTPRSREELRGLLCSSELKASTDSALPYGYYMATFGTPFLHYAPETLFSGKFLGHDLQERSLVWRGLKKTKAVLKGFFDRSISKAR
jgi:hypothetical protein